MSGPAHNILGSLPVPKLVWTMSAPIMLSMLMSAIYNLVDSIYVAQVSELDFLALSYAYPVQLMMVAFCAGTGVGFNALFAQRLGAGQKEEANRVACHGFLFYGLCWLLFLAFALLGAPLFFRLSTDNAAVAAAGTSYLVICCGLSIGMCMQFLTERLLQTTGHPAGFMIVQGSGAILNIILDPVFIFGLDMGVVGAAAATVIGQISGACIGFFLLWRIRGEFSVSFRGFRPDRALSAELLRIAAPAVVMQSLSSFMSLGLNQLLTRWSDTAVFVLGVYFKIQSFVFMPIFGVNSGLIPILSYNYGAKSAPPLPGGALRGAAGSVCRRCGGCPAGPGRRPPAAVLLPCRWSGRRHGGARSVHGRPLLPHRRGEHHPVRRLSVPRAQRELSADRPAAADPALAPHRRPVPLAGPRRRLAVLPDRGDDHLCGDPPPLPPDRPPPDRRTGGPRSFVRLCFFLTLSCFRSLPVSWSITPIYSLIFV